jgi:hypothetical protein
MADVVQLRPKDMTWACTCGCVTFKVFTDGRLECAACESRDMPGHGEWIEILPDPPAEPRQTKGDQINIINMQDQSAAAALAGMMRRAKNYPEEMTALIVIHENSKVTTWGGIQHQVQVRWLRNRLKEAFELLTVCLPKGRDDRA